MGRTLLLTACLLSLGACGFATAARVTFNDPLRPEDVRFIVPGRTSLSEIVARLGAPQTITELVDGGLITYQFRDATFSRINFGWPLQFVTPVQPDLIVSGSGLAVDVLLVTFDRQWIAREVAFGLHPEAARFNPIQLFE